MSDALILSACRTPMGRFQGALASVAAVDLGAAVVRAAVERAGASPDDIDDVVMGMVLAAGVGQAPARQAALRGGLPPGVSAVTVNKVCGSGLEAIAQGARSIRCGDAELVVAGGMESMSRAAYVVPRTGPPLGDRTLLDTLTADGLTCAISGRLMGDLADDLASRENISRSEQDAYALQSHRRAVRAVESGAFSREIVPVTVRKGGADVPIVRDEGPREDTGLDRLAALKTAFRPDGSVTAGNASLISDGAAAVVLGSSSAAERLGGRPLARVLASVTVGLPPEDLFIAPALAVTQVLTRAGLSPTDVGLLEINEAFAGQVIACTRRLDFSPDRVNVSGGGIALGHPIGASGARVLVTLLHALRERNLRYGAASLCLGGGNAIAMAIERLDAPA